MKLTTAHLLLWYKTFATIAGASDVHKRKKIEKLTSSGFPALPLKIIRAHIKPKKTPRRRPPGSGILPNNYGREMPSAIMAISVESYASILPSPLTSALARPSAESSPLFTR